MLMNSKNKNYQSAIEKFIDSIIDMKIKIAIPFSILKKNGIKNFINRLRKKKDN